MGGVGGRGSIGRRVSGDSRQSCRRVTGARVVGVADSFLHSDPPGGSRPGRAPTGSKITPKNQAAAPSGPHPSNQEQSQSHTACISGCRAELCKLKDQIPSFLGYLTVCLARRGVGSGEGLLVTDTRACLAAPDREALITWKTPDTRTPNDE